MITLIYLYLLGVIFYPFTMLIKKINYTFLKKTIKIIVFGIGIVICFEFNYSYLINEIEDTSLLTLLIAFLIGIFYSYLSIIMVNNFQIICVHILIEKRDLVNTISILFTCVYEEIIWRGTIQNYFISKFDNLIVVLILALLFMLSHFKNRFRYIALLDIGVFSIFISCIYYFWGNLTFVIVIHFSRNLIIEFLNFGKS